MATILEGLNQIAEKLGGAESTSNLEALNAISGALGGSADATENAEAIANIAENASGGGGVKPAGTLQIKENGTYDVSVYANAEVYVDGVTKNKVKLQNNTNATAYLYYSDAYGGKLSTMSNIGPVMTNSSRTIPIGRYVNASYTDQGYVSGFFIVKIASSGTLNLACDDVAFTLGCEQLSNTVKSVLGISDTAAWLIAVKGTTNAISNTPTITMTVS